MRSSGRSFSDDQGRLLGAMRDVTTEREAELLLCERETHHRTVISTLREGIVQQEADGHISTCNAAAERILGLREDQLMGRSSTDPHWHIVREDGKPLPGRGAAPDDDITYRRSSTRCRRGRA